MNRPKRWVPPPPPKSEGRQYLMMLAALLLLVTALVPMEFGIFLAIGNVILIWVLLAIPLGRSMSRDAEGAQKLFFGCLGILTAGFGAILLVGFSCSMPFLRGIE